MLYVWTRAICESIPKAAQNVQGVSMCASCCHWNKYKIKLDYTCYMLITLLQLRNNNIFPRLEVLAKVRQFCSTLCVHAPKCWPIFYVFTDTYTHLLSYMYKWKCMCHLRILVQWRLCFCFGLRRLASVTNSFTRRINYVFDCHPIPSVKPYRRWKFTGMPAIFNPRPSRCGGYSDYTSGWHL